MTSFPDVRTLAGNRLFRLPPVSAVAFEDCGVDGSDDDDCCEVPAPAGLVAGPLPVASPVDVFAVLEFDVPCPALLPQADKTSAAEARSTMYVRTLIGPRATDNFDRIGLPFWGRAATD